MLRFSIPLIPLQVASFILSMSDRFFLQQFRALEEVGLYSLGYKFAAVLPLLTIEPFKGFVPHIFNLIERPDECKSTLSDFGRYYLAAGLFLALAIGMFSREVIIIMSDPEFHAAYNVVFFLCISYVFYGLYFFSSYAIKIIKKTWLISIPWLIAVIFSLALNYNLVPVYGIYGAVIASVTSYFVLVVCNLIVGYKAYPVNYKYSLFLAVLIYSALLYYLSTLITFGIVLSIILKLAILILFVIGLFIFGYFSHEERSKIIDAIKQYVSFKK
jgi:O-antigen/teichoic acid export membrane protein